LFQVKVLLQNVPQQRLELPGLTLMPVQIDSETSEFDLMVVLAEADDGRVRGLIKYKKELFGHNTIARIVALYGACLDTLAAEPNTSLEALARLLDDHDRERKHRSRQERALKHAEALKVRMRPR
jgi:hypothetical protein